ncbi:MAG TPA: HAMP domain-containing sensor histidine kinase, partial [Kineosporiaceae bacterium]|nr:HAMP domain-containing sensor histidine kinase [Kineosporiaceae bacterium]
LADLLLALWREFGPSWCPAGGPPSLDTPLLCVQLRRRPSIVSGLALAPVLLVYLAGCWLAVRWCLRPVRDLVPVIANIGPQNLGHRLRPGPGHDELAVLGRTIDEMMDRIAVGYEAQRRFAADASHELRTPLTTIRTNAVFLRDHLDAAPDDRAAAVADIEAEAARMSRLVDDLLTLARADGGARLARQPVDLAALAAQVCRRAATSHPDRRIVCTGPPVHLAGDADALQRLLGVLLDNAVRHTRDGGAVWVTVTSPAPGQAVLQVADDGEGIPPGQEERIFDRFHQADPSRRRGGAGLGLAIARWIAHEHGGWVTAGPTSGGGATFTVTLAPGPPVPGSSPA